MNTRDLRNQFQSFVETDSKFMAFTERILRELQHKQTEITRDQFIDLMYQAVASGDFMMNVRQGDYAQAMIYVPFAEQERSRSRIKELEETAGICADLLRIAKTHLDHCLLILDDDDAAKKIAPSTKAYIDVVISLLTPPVTNPA